jgi:dipeptidyl aminopeptidase/acylaminoacyl peptidase
VSPAGELIIGAQFTDPGRYGLYVLSLDSGKIERPYLVNDRYDVEGSVQDPYTNHVVGATLQEEEPTVVWFDEELARHQQSVDAALGFPTRITSWSSDRSRFIVLAEHAELPPAYYLFEPATSSLRMIASAYPEAHQAGVAPRLGILYPARDGVQIPAYLTMADDLQKPAPLIVVPHGGPEARDVGGFDWLAHFLASRGYVVLQPNYRGSDGYGAAWRDAGRGGWGTGVMQQDITDGVAALVDAGIADRERVCIVGASYGGYAALAGATFTPELYRCAVAISPIADVNGFIDYQRDRSERGSATVTYWETVAGGDLGAAGDRLRAISPARNVDNVQAPILLIHGRDDSVVPISQSRSMESALRGAGKSVELVELSGEDHWLSRADTRLETLEAVDAFLATHLGG